MFQRRTVSVMVMLAAPLLRGQTGPWISSARSAPSCPTTAFSAMVPTPPRARPDCAWTAGKPPWKPVRTAPPWFPASPADSLLYQRISDPDAAFRMPPEDSHKKLTAAQIATAQTVDRTGRSVEGALGVSGAREAARYPR